MDQIQQDIWAFLTRPNDIQVATRLIEDGEAAFDRILHYSGPYPEGSFPMDMWDDFLIPMLGRIGIRWPDILCKHLANPDPDRSGTIILAAICSKDPRFTDLLITHLGSRSYSCIDLVLGAMRKHEYLQVESALPYLEKLLAGKKIAHLLTKPQEIETLLAKIKLKGKAYPSLEPIREKCPCGAGFYVRRRYYDDGGGDYRDAGIREDWSMECAECSKTYVVAAIKGFEPHFMRWVLYRVLNRYEKAFNKYMDQLGEITSLARSEYLEKWHNFFINHSDVEVWRILYAAGLYENVTRCTNEQHTITTSWPAFEKQLRRDGRALILSRLFVDKNFPAIFRLLGIKDQKMEALMAREQEYLKASLAALEEMKRKSCYPGMNSNADIIREDQNMHRPATSEGVPASPKNPETLQQPAVCSPQKAGKTAVKLSLFLAACSFRSFMLMSLGLLAFYYAFGEYAETRRFITTPPVKGKIIEFKRVKELVQTKRGAKAGYATVKEMYLPRATYEYTVNGKLYTCSNISRNGSEVYVATFPIFPNPQVFYDPDNPSNAYLDWNFDYGFAQTLTLMGIILVGWAIARTIRIAREKLDNQSGQQY